jgi:hypothetical protein
VILPPKLLLTRFDGGLLTEYAPNVKNAAKPVSGSSLRRSYIIVNDPDCPIEIGSFSFRTEAMQPSASCPSAKQLNDGYGPYECGKLLYVLEWSLKARSPVTAWETYNSVFDAMNRFLWTDTSLAEGRATRDMNPGKEFKMDRIFWWGSAHTDNLAKWITSVLFVGSARMKDGTVWRCDNHTLQAQMKALSLEIPSDLKQ